MVLNFGYVRQVALDPQTGQWLHPQDAPRNIAINSEASDRLGHCGLLDFGQGVQKFSIRYEADLDRGGAIVLDVRPLQCKDGWPGAGDDMNEGTDQIESVRTGTVIEMAAEGVMDQLADGSWRIPLKSVPGSKDVLALSAVGSSFAALAKFDPDNEKQRWLVKAP